MPQRQMEKPKHLPESDFNVARGWLVFMADERDIGINGEDVNVTGGRRKGNKNER